MLKTLSGGITAVISTAAIIPSTYIISGTVSVNGSILPGVTVTLSGKSSGSTTTDEHGYYYFTGLTAGSYSVSASMTGYSISPASIPVTITNTNQIGKNFTATPIYAISGTITEDASPLSGVTVALTGDETDSKVTGAGGTYSFINLSDGDYTVTPSLSGYAFDPADIDVTLSGADSTGNDFEARETITKGSDFIIHDGGASQSVSALSSHPSAPASAAVDNNTTYSYWLGTGGGIDWWRVDLGVGITKKCYSYKLLMNIVPEPNRAPKAWTFEGSNGGAYTVLDTQTNQTSWGSGESREFELSDKSGAYRYYRANITENNGDATYTQICEIYMYEAVEE